MAAGTPGKGAGKPPPSKVGTTDWRVMFLHGIGAPVTRGNLAALQAWALSESGYNSTYGTNMAGPFAYNPLAITVSVGIPVVGDLNSVGVKRFGSTAAGVTATIRFMQHFGYSAVINALRNDDQAALYTAVNQSGWCRGCQGGHYPIGLYNYVNGGSVQGGTATFQGSAGGPSGMSGIDAANSANATGLVGNKGSTSGSADSGGLFGSCSGGSTGHGGLSVGGAQLTPNLFSTPTVSGFGCYIEQSIKFIGFTAGGALLMTLGMAMVILPAMRSKLGPVGALVGGGAGIATGLAGRVGLGSELASSTGTEAAAATREIQRARREQRADELHAERLKQQRARTRVERSRARQEKLAEGSPTRLSAVEEARIKRAQKRQGNPRPDRMAG